MGRLKKAKTGTFDRIGERVNLVKCPECREHPDCFACLSCKCTALNMAGGNDCVFYKPAEKALIENRETCRKLKKEGRKDLIEKYTSTFTAMGLLDDQIEASDAIASQLKAFEAEDLQERLKVLRGIPSGGPK